MGVQQKAANQVQDLGGKAKEELGHMTGDQEIEREGHADQAKAAVKDLGESVKDVAEKVGETAKQTAHRIKEAVTSHQH